jgi:hypothetical protein
MGNRKVDKIAATNLHQAQPALEQPVASQSATARTIAGLRGVPHPAAHAVQLSHLVTGSPTRAGQAARQLQRAYGNRYVAQVAQQAQPGGTPLVVQPKLTVTPPGDHYEEEADRVANQVMQRISSPTVQRTLTNAPKDAYEEEDLDRPAGQVMRQVTGESGEVTGMAVDGGVESAIQGAQGSGQPLPEGTGEAMERAFSADFAGVRVHIDAQADALNESLQARAFTTGQDIFFKQSEYAPESAEGQRLLAHELTHVVQQRSRSMPRTRMALSNPTDALVQRQPIDIVDPTKKTAWYNPFPNEYDRLIKDYQVIQKILTTPELFEPALKALDEEVGREEARSKSAGKPLASVDYLDIVLLRHENEHGINLALRNSESTPCSRNAWL